MVPRLSSLWAMSLRSRCRDGMATMMLVNGTLALPPFVAVMMWQLICTAIVLTAIERKDDESSSSG